MKEDLQYEMVQKMERWENDERFEAYICSFDFPLVVDNDWNPYIFQLTKTSKEDFVACPDNEKIGFILINCSYEFLTPYFHRFRKHLGVD